jgi:hypothetical protein
MLREVREELETVLGILEGRASHKSVNGER